jgi:hypothetical protein
VEARELWGIGQFRSAGESVPLPVSYDDVAQDTDSARKTLASLGVGRGHHVLFTSLLSESATFWPFQQAVLSVGGIVSCAEATPFDAFRTEMFARRLPLETVLGLNADVLDGLAALGRASEQVFARVPIIVARSLAYERLRDAGLRPYLWLPLGPAVAVECRVRAGAHVDSGVWQAESAGGEIVLSSRVPRAFTVDGLRTGVRAEVATDPCPCGRPDPRIVIASHQ